ncbi:3-methyladenine DNA glycosylase, partial [Nocardioides sp.]|uniref:3-methyladenine DNA glycosylase n=1 Tax=Nocardioides sp. TaxID=35761 RepID=UPI002D7E7A28
MDLQVLDEATWRARAEAHAARVDTFVGPHLARRRDGVKHPVHDFLFTYYSHRPAQLRRWHPGYGVALAGGEISRGYERVMCPTAPQASASGPLPDLVTVSASFVADQAGVIESVLALLRATAGRPAQLGCFGLHEWAMVHRTDRVRHDWPLRLGGAGTDQVVESHRISCSHFDAFRFFTPAARPLNTLSPSSGDRASYEQPGCLHANMDLYKHAF